ncbi:MAG: hypothetical protein ABR579_04890 [Actinomycetota bacterium]
MIAEAEAATAGFESRATLWRWVFVLVVVTWPITRISFTPAQGLDNSWQAGLHMAAHSGLQFGHDIVFSYGPLGWLTIPTMFFAWTGVLAWLFVGLTHVSLCATLLVLSRRRLGSPACYVVAFLGALAAHGLYTEVLPVIVFLWCCELLTWPESRTDRWWLAPAGGTIAAVAMLVKLNDGLAILAMTAITVIGVSINRRRDLPAYAASFVAGLCLAWLASLQSITNLWSYLTSSFQIVSGYSTAMGREEGGFHGDAVLAVVVVVLLTIAFRAAFSDVPRKRRRFLWVLLIAWLFFYFKQTFVHHDHIHGVVIFAAVLIACAGFLSSRVDRSMRAVILVGSVGCFLAVSGIGVWGFINPWPHLREAVFQTRVVANPTSRGSFIDSSRAAMQSNYQMDGQTLSVVEGGTVHVDPWEIGIAWAYPEIHWHPLPVFQSYSAYTQSLDQRNAEALESSDGPSLILRNTHNSLDDRNFRFESPAASLATVCNYKQVSVTDKFLVLGKTADRCSDPSFLGAATIHLQESVIVPAAPGPDDLVYARISGVDSSLVQKVRALLFKSSEWSINQSGVGAFRLVPGTADDPLILRVPHSADYSPPFSLGPDTSSFFLVNQGFRESRSEMTVDFYAVKVNPDE